MLSGSVLGKPLMVVSIHPLALLATEVVGEHVEVEELLPVGELPHQYSLRLSQRQLLADADMILWVGPELERFLANAVAAEPPQKVIQAASLPGIVFPDTGDNNPIRDYHLWLNPDNGQKVARAVAEWLTGIEPSLKATLDHRLAVLDKQLKSASVDLEQQFTVLQSQRFIVDHDAFSHFAGRFGLRQVGSLHHASGLTLGARELAGLYQQKNIACVVVEPRYQEARVKAIAEKLGATLEVIDPLGAEINAAKGGYVALIAQVGEAFAHCLSHSAN